MHSLLCSLCGCVWLGFGTASYYFPSPQAGLSASACHRLCNGSPFLRLIIKRISNYKMQVESRLVPHVTWRKWRGSELSNVYWSGLAFLPAQWLPFYSLLAAFTAAITCGSIPVCWLPPGSFVFLIFTKRLFCYLFFKLFSILQGQRQWFFVDGKTGVCILIFPHFDFFPHPFKNFW